MFLTTNRAGVLDQAVKSRVTLSLYYDHLTEDQTLLIFKIHIERLREIDRQRNAVSDEKTIVLHKEILQFAKNQYIHGGKSGRWNGKQIRNAFLIASSLAQYDGGDEGNNEDEDELAGRGRKKQKTIGRRHFEIIAETMLETPSWRGVH
jgi:hypothetical protein